MYSVAHIWTCIRVRTATGTEDVPATACSECLALCLSARAVSCSMPAPACASESELCCLAWCPVRSLVAARGSSCDCTYANTDFECPQSPLPENRTKPLPHNSSVSGCELGLIGNNVSSLDACAAACEAMPTCYRASFLNATTGECFGRGNGSVSYVNTAFTGCVCRGSKPGGPDSKHTSRQLSHGVAPDVSL